MIQYFYIILLVSFFSFLDFIKLENKRLLFYFLLIVLILFAGTRFETGNDWREYVKVFARVPCVNDLWNNLDLVFLYRMEPGYIILNSIVKTCGGSINEVFLISCIFIISLYFISLRKYTFLPFIAVLLYMRYGYLQTNMMFVRQGIAISIFFYSVQYIKTRDIIKYVVLNIIASFFHSSLLLTLPLYFVINRRYSNYVLFAFVFLSILLSFSNWSYLLPKILPPIIQENVINYTESDIWGGMTGKLNVAIIEKIVIFLVCIIYRKEMEKANGSFNVFLNLFVISIICYYAFFQMYVFQQRLAMIFQFSTVVIISQMILLLSLKMRFFLLMVLNLVIIYFFLRYISMGEDVFIPYKSWLI